MGVIPPPRPDTGEPDPSIEGPSNTVIGEDLDVGSFARFAIAVSVATGIVLASVHYAPLVLEDGSVVMSDGLRGLLARVPSEFAYTAVASLVGSALWALLRDAWPKPLKDGESPASARREVRTVRPERGKDGTVDYWGRDAKRYPLKISLDQPAAQFLPKPKPKPKRCIQDGCDREAWTHSGNCCDHAFNPRPERRCTATLASGPVCGAIAEPGSQVCRRHAHRATYSSR